ncbi:hypothetical protein [Pseudoduganella aquatica]|uniref:Uncharacterized protein n=1 Tax=Pseudoduganella aquatica TaxID=2660641 RepID=A0A7X4HHA0_9BURK|nr:hypothetical protein [Pseudoduganella aquatica]MYN11236.1 hypothetical protein [Pseudoduganella aquatica]
MTQSESNRSAWERPAVTFRLSSRRRQDLLALGGGRAAASPTSALDIAIALALQAARDDERSGLTPNEGNGDRANAARVEIAEPLDGGGELRPLVASLREDAARTRGMLADVASQVRELRDAILSAASQADDENSESDAALAAPEPMRSWLNREALALPRPALLVKARWIASRRLSASNVRIELGVQRQAAVVEGAAGPGASATISLDMPVSGERPIRLDRPEAFYLMCQREANGAWRIGLRLVSADGKLAPASAAFTL